MRVAVLGAGAWGTALALHAHRLGHAVTLAARDPAPLLARRESPRLPGHGLPPGLAVAALPPPCDLLLVGVPMQPLRAALQALPGPLPPLVLLAKGLETASGLLPLEVLAQACPGARGAVLSGPNFAHEVAAGLPAAAVVAGEGAALAQDALAGPSFRLYRSDDPLGVQLGGAAKNVLAIAAGICTGAGLGENARAALVTRGLAELSRLVVALGGQAGTASGLSGLGDLLLTATGLGSRNTSLGIALGRGARLAEVMAGRSAVTEGVATAPALLARAAAAGVELPICAAVAALLAGRLDVPGALRALMDRPAGSERSS